MWRKFRGPDLPVTLEYRRCGIMNIAADLWRVKFTNFPILLCGWGNNYEKNTLFGYGRERIHGWWLDIVSGGWISVGNWQICCHLIQVQFQGGPDPCKGTGRAISANVLSTWYTYQVFHDGWHLGDKLSLYTLNVFQTLWTKTTQWNATFT